VGSELGRCKWFLWHGNLCQALQSISSITMDTEIATAFVESTVNQVIAKRMVKKQQMRWSPRGAHLLLQVRTRVLNDQLADDFHRWHPRFQRRRDDLALAA
jgi:uncharacterized membrane-anchored protein YjiN (DUF445 family)